MQLRWDNLLDQDTKKNYDNYDDNHDDDDDDEYAADDQYEDE